MLGHRDHRMLQRSSHLLTADLRCPHDRHSPGGPAAESLTETKRKGELVLIDDAHLPFSGFLQSVLHRKTLAAYRKRDAMSENRTLDSALQEGLCR